MPFRYSNRSVLLYMGTEIERMGKALDATKKSIEDGIQLCGDVLRSGYEYDSVDSVASACFHLACQRQDEPISLPDVADQSRKSQKNIQHLSANLMSELEIKLTPVEPDTYLEEGVERFEFTDEQATECFDLLERGKHRNLHSGYAPTTIAGAILYAIVKKYRLNVNQGEISSFVNKTDVSIRNNYKQFLKLADNVPVDVLPPQSIDEAIETLRTKFSDYPTVFADDARQLVESIEYSDTVSRAGIAGGAYFVVAKEHGEDISPEKISAAVGVGRQTIMSHSEKFQNDS